MSRMSRTIFVFVTIHLLAAVTSQELEKRGPQGFLGMRGKKLNDGTEQFYKRRPQFFVGVKGKKDAYDDFESPDLYYKRAPMGFMGMRGKKDIFSDEEKRAPMGFVGMRGKKEIYSDEEKRAPMGFVGMRGKKPFSDEENYYPEVPESFEYSPRRGSLIGQIDYNSNERTDEFPLLSDIINEYLNKLQSQNSIETETEASEIDERITNEVEKRAANMHQFFGVRGKKSLQNKRVPYDVSFRGKFIGVRGKKDLNNSGPQEIKFLLDQRGPFPKRKGSVGFIGMRGKKWTDGEIL